MKDSWSNSGVMRLPLLLSTQLFIDGWVAHENYDVVQKLIGELEETWDENILFRLSHSKTESILTFSRNLYKYNV